LTSSFATAIELLDGVFSRSQVLSRLGYATHTREVSDKTEWLPATCKFILLPGDNRRLVVSFCFRPDGDHFFTVELFRSDPPASFLIEEWMSLVGASLSPYPFTLSSYTGDLLRQMQGFVAFLETQLSTSAVERVLNGADWLDVPCDWGGLR
jgi:hypothetical protein